MSEWLDQIGKLLEEYASDPKTDDVWEVATQIDELGAAAVPIRGLFTAWVVNLGWKWPPPSPTEKLPESVMMDDEFKEYSSPAARKAALDARVAGRAARIQRGREWLAKGLVDEYGLECLVCSKDEFNEVVNGQRRAGIWAVN